jgi:hypothetical protein
MEMFTIFRKELDWGGKKLVLENRQGPLVKPTGP